MAGSVKQREAAVAGRPACARTAQRLERAVQAQNSGRLLLPRRRAKRSPTLDPAPQLRQSARRFYRLDPLPPAHWAGQPTSLTDPDGNTTSYAYNAANQLVSTTNPMGYQTTYAYNSAGLLTSTTDADGRTINYAYNADGQETSESWVNGNYTATYAYNADGELTSASDPYSVYTYTYDALGNVTSVDNAGTPGVPTVTLSYAYDSFGNRVSLSDSLGGNISYAYNANKQMTGLALTVSGTLDAQLTFAYDAVNNLTGTTRTDPSANGDTITTSYSYDALDELTNITDTDATQGLSLANYSYAYNAGGELSSYQDSNSSLTYGYDANGELTSASGTLNSNNYSVSYSYDANGNRTMSGYQTGPGNELLSDGTYSYTYDHNGNTLTQTNIATGSVTYYTWDYRNRLTEVKVENSQGQTGKRTGKRDNVNYSLSAPHGIAWPRCPRALRHVRLVAESTPATDGQLKVSLRREGDLRSKPVAWSGDHATTRCRVLHPPPARLE